jgi:recombination protein RecT
MDIENTEIELIKAESAEIEKKMPKKSITDLVCDDLYRYEGKLLPLLNGDKTQFEKLMTGFSFALVDKGLHGCDKASIIKSFKMCCAFNLDPSIELGKVYLIKYYNKKSGFYECNAQIGYRGYLDLIMRRTDIVSHVYTNTVYEGDEFWVKNGKDCDYHHAPKFESDELWLTYAVIKFQNGDIQIRVAKKSNIEKSKNLSPSSNDKYSPWNTNYNSMAELVPLRKIAKPFALAITNESDFIYHEEEKGRRENEIKMVNSASYLEIPDNSEQIQEVI